MPLETHILFQERRILEETVTHLTPTGLAGQQLGQTTIVSSPPGTNETQTENAPLQENGHRMAPGNEDQHASKLHFFLGRKNRDIFPACSPVKCNKSVLFYLSSKILPLMLNL